MGDIFSTMAALGIGFLIYYHVGINGVKRDTWYDLWVCRDMQGVWGYCCFVHGSLNPKP